MLQHPFTFARDCSGVATEQHNDKMHPSCGGAFFTLGQFARRSRVILTFCPQVMKKIYKAGRQHLHKAFAGDLESLLLLYSHRAELWRDPNYIREIPPALLFIDFLSKMRSDIAFQLVPVVADWLLSNSDQVGTDCRFWLLLSIAESSSTTEIPIRLKSRMESLRQAAMAHGDAAIEPFSQLLRYYRLDPNELPDENGAEQNAEPELPITGF